MEKHIQHDWNEPNGKMGKTVNIVSAKNGAKLKSGTLP